jgi:hypothetical protein
MQVAISLGIRTKIRISAGRMTRKMDASDRSQAGNKSLVS